MHPLLAAGLTDWLAGWRVACGEQSCVSDIHCQRGRGHYQQQTAGELGQYMGTLGLNNSTTTTVHNCGTCGTSINMYILCSSTITYMTVQFYQYIHNSAVHQYIHNYAVQSIHA